MATETGAARTGKRPNPLLMILFGIVVVVFVASRFSGSPAAPAVQSPAKARTPAAANGADIDPKDLDVRIETLKQPGPGLADAERNPFRFRPPPPPPPPPESSRPKPGPTTQPPFATPAPPVVIGPPPIGNLIKFIGFAETANGKIGAFSTWDAQTRECKATFPGREGEVIEGRYRVVRIGIESAVLEYLDGKGRTTLPLNGQACVAK